MATANVLTSGGVPTWQGLLGRAAEREADMSIYKRGDVYWYKFMWRGELIRESTKQGNDKVARQQEAAHRTLLSNGEVFIREKKQVPTFGEFIKARFEPWARGAFDPASQTWKSWYSPSIHV